MNIRWLGRVQFALGLHLQEQYHAQCLATGEETVLLLEHDPVYTIGRTLDRTSLRDPARLPHPVFEINRGGQATFHGPGQLVGYPILDLRRRQRDLHRYLRSLEALLIDLLRDFGIAASGATGKTGVWVDDRKIASIGVGVRKWIAMHGFALNVSPDLAGFDSITPCGLSGVPMTSVSREVGGEIELTEVVSRIVPYLALHLSVVARTASSVSGGDARGRTSYPSSALDENLQP
jgi:lipoyl(octanoyl) transferase